MTAAQKTAKDKFKKAIAYRQKTGVSLKEAFEHIYGKKVGAVKKKAVKKKPYKGYQYTIDENETGDFVDKYFTLTEAKKDLKKLESNSKKSGKYKKDFYRITDLNSGKTIGAIKKKAAKKVIRKVVKKKAAPKKVAKKKLTPRDYDLRYSAKKPGKRTSASGNTYYENRGNRSDTGKLLGIKKYNYEQLDNIRLTRVNNDVNGNPRYVVHFLEFLNNEENSFLPFSKKYEYALKKAKKIGGRKFHNKQYGGGIVFQSYNTDNLKEQIIDVMETTPKIKY